MSKLLLMCLATLALAGCNSASDESKATEGYRALNGVAIKPSNRVTVDVIGSFEDEIAYDDERRIYLIVDNETGKEFIGISGVGISETGSHSAGKSRRMDER